jgi:hypothetical protein
MHNEDTGKVIELAISHTSGISAGFELHSSSEAKARANAQAELKAAGPEKRSTQT